MSFINFIENKINVGINQKFVSIIGSNPSKGARSPALWNKAFFNLKIKLGETDGMSKIFYCKFTNLFYKLVWKI